ncbi:MAG TPA: type II toxin-antitoxin system HicB family antitoxin [Fimbriimonadaceae bacterium]
MILHIVLEPGEDGYILASVPALPGCHTQGRTREEALTNAKEAITGWLESQDSPPPGSPSAEIVQIAV